MEQKLKNLEIILINEINVRKRKREDYNNRKCKVYKRIPEIITELDIIDIMEHIKDVSTDIYIWESERFISSIEKLRKEIKKE